MVQPVHSQGSNAGNFSCRDHSTLQNHLFNSSCFVFISLVSFVIWISFCWITAFNASTCLAHTNYCYVLHPLVFYGVVTATVLDALDTKLDGIEDPKFMAFI